MSVTVYLPTSEVTTTHEEKNLNVNNGVSINMAMEMYSEWGADHWLGQNQLTVPPAAALLCPPTTAKALNILLHAGLAMLTGYKCLFQFNNTSKAILS